MDSSGCVEQLQIDYTVNLELHCLLVKMQECADELEFRNEKTHTPLCLQNNQLEHGWRNFIITIYHNYLKS